MRTILMTILMTGLLNVPAYAGPKFKKQKRKISSSSELIKEIGDQDKKVTQLLNSVINNVHPAKLPDGSPDYEQTSKAVKQGITQILAIAKQYPNSDIAQLYKSAAEHIPHFKGFIYRLRKIVEVSDMAYISAIWSLKQFKQTSNYRAPYMEALFDMMTQPNPEEEILGQKGMFQTVAQLQDWMVNQMAPRFDKTINDIKAIAFKTQDALHPVGVINAELLVGKVIAQRYEPSKHTHKEWVLTSGHLVGLVATLENYMGYLYYLSAYNLEKAAELTNLLTKETFIATDGPTSRSEIFASSSKRVDLISSKRVYELTYKKPGKRSVGLFGPYSVASNHKEDYRAFATIRPEAKQPVNGQDNYLKSAQYYFRLGAEDQLQYHLAMVQSYGVSGEDQLIVNPVSYKASLELTPYIDNEAILEKTLEVLNSEGPITIQDHFIKKSYTVDVSTLFDVKKVDDLRKFLPNKFLDSRKERSPEEPPGLNWYSGNITKWRNTFEWNYLYNKATQWQEPTFAGLLPKIESEKQGDSMNLHLLNIASQPEIPYIGLWLSMFYGY